MLVAVKPIYDAVGIERINVTTYQSVSGAGKAGMEELLDQTSAFLNSQSYDQQVFPQAIAFNAIPQIDQWMENGYTREEMKMLLETQKILQDGGIRVNPTCVRVPVFIGHSMAINIETREKISLAQVKQLLLQAPGIILMDEREYPTPAVEGNAQDAVYVGRLREDISHPRGINLWVVADNVRKGAALNAIQIAEIYIRDCLGTSVMI
jgi:aspartate-semialdehyde dehydrogenase